MTHEEAKYLSDVLKAYSDGKIIEYRKKNTIYAWEVYKGQNLDENCYVYRIKPEQKLRPYKDAAEFLNAQKEHGPYIDTENWTTLGTYTIPYSINNSRVYWNAGYDLYSNWEELSHHVWQDGTPCGILEE